MRKLPFRLFLAVIASYATLALFACAPRNIGLDVHSVTGRTERIVHRPAWPLPVILGHSIEGRPIECHAFGGGDDVVLFMATIHGNESAGIPLLHELARYLTENPSVLHTAAGSCSFPWRIRTATPPRRATTPTAST